ncbi:MAG: hypothetical protein JXC85_01630 [Candidatus Aenigmarchaeota archaeon]|nr:hypothetical protein [Candidatus Aenigmarchaeota archaeon]
MLKSFMAIALFALALAALPIASAQADKNISAVYFTGIGCPHCAKADPVVLNDLLIEYPNLIIVEYEIYQDQSNAPLIFSYNEIYESGIGIPLLIFANGQSIVGDIPIMNDARNVLDAIGSIGCPLPDGTSADIRFLDMSKMPGNPKFWTNDRVVIPGPGTDAGILRDLLLEENLTKVLASGNFRLDHDDMVPLSGGQIKFQHAATIGQSSIKWNGECPDLPLPDDETCDNESAFGYDSPRSLEDLTVIKILFLAAVDAVNPCALAVLTLMLIAILTYDPKARRKILLAGMAFTLSVFIMYIVYGLVIIRFFQLIQAITSIRLVLYRILGAVAMILGILNLKDFFRYKPGGMMTEMPMRMRPKLKKLISGITSPRGAFLVGAFVTVFLLPCTIGPYVIAGGILSALEILQTIPWLVLYNLVFVVPMVAITLLVYFGTKEVEDVSGWKDRNIRYLHLVSGSIILLLGLSMLLGLL